MNKEVSDRVRDMTNNNNDKIVEVVALENKILNTDDNDDSIVAVSYTHLLLEGRRGVRSVSYTHLDVYKRQDVCRESGE